jgi:hypothetical protein
VIGAVAIAADGNNGRDLRDDVQIRAMADEIARSKTLQLSNLDKPYFIQYSTSDANELSARASLGGLISSQRIHFRAPRVEVRVGDYQFDNTNSIFSRMANIRAFPLDDDYPALRTAFWLTTDSLYKLATDQITRKRNALREISDPDKTADFAIAKPVQIALPSKMLALDQDHWNDAVRQVSGRFVNHPDVLTSAVSVRIISSTYRLVNSEGTEIRIPQDVSELQIRATAIAPDGNKVWNHRFITALDPSGFPRTSELDKAADAVASETEALAKAPLASDYSGPVLFEQAAAAQLIAQVMANATWLPRKPIAPRESTPRLIENVWASRLGSKVTPDWLSIWDDPAQRDFKGTALAGAYQVDDEGVPAERVALVDKGTLKGFLLSREPVRDFKASNGHGRLPGAFGSEQPVLGNLFVQADNALSEAKLKAKLLEKIKAEGLKFGLMIRKLDFPSTASYEELESMVRQVQKDGYFRTLNSPLLAYQVYPDGREELVRGLRFREFSAKNLRDIIAASDHPYVLNYVNNGNSVNHADAGSDATTSSVICPSLIIDDVELARAENEPNKAPVVSAPALIQ